MTEENGSADAGNPEPSAPIEAAPAAAPAAPAQANWLTGVADDGLRAWAEAKGLHNGTVDNTLSSYRNLEKVFGAEKAGMTVLLPGPDADAATMTGFYNRLGRPKESSGYDLPVPPGDDGAMATWAKDVFHEVGLTSKQAHLLSVKWNEKIAGMQTDATQRNTASATEAEATLRKEWGAAYDQKTAGVNAAAGKLGMKEAELAGLRASMGPVAAMKFVDGLASRLGEAVIDNDNIVASRDGNRTPAAAQVEMNRLTLDAQFMEAWLNRQHPAHGWAVETKAGLARQIAGEAA